MAQSNLDIKFLTLVVGIEGKCFIGKMTTLERHEMFNGNPCSCSIIDLPNEIVTMVCFSNYQIPNYSTPRDLNNRDHFLAYHSQEFNILASKFANLMDHKNINCVVGNCAFVFDTNTQVTEQHLGQAIIECFQ